MFDYTLIQSNPAPKSASEVVLRLRELNQLHERLNAAYKKEVKSRSRRQNILKALLTSFVSLF